MHFIWLSSNSSGCGENKKSSPIIRQKFWKKPKTAIVSRLMALEPNTNISLEDRTFPSSRAFQDAPELAPGLFLGLFIFSHYLNPSRITCNIPMALSTNSLNTNWSASTEK